MELNTNYTLHIYHNFLSDFFFDFLYFYVERKKIIQRGTFTTIKQ